MKIEIIAVMFLISASAGMSYAADDSTSLGNQASPKSTGGAVAPQSLGEQTGEAVRELKGSAAESYAVASAKAVETSGKVEAEAQDAFKVFQKQWEALAEQLQEKMRQISKQLQKQVEDFNKSLNQPS